LKILSADYLLTCDEDFTILKDAAVCFDEKIIDIGDKDSIIQKYPYAIVKHLSPNSVIMPGLINTHVHLEFSANKTTLEYGDFTRWLQSVIEKREALTKRCVSGCFEEAIEQMVLSGVSAFGEISSFGADLNICFKAPQRVVFFNEILGSNTKFADDIEKDFKYRLNKSCDFESEHFTTALSIHSLYSTHPKILDFALNIAKENDFLISTHFMESYAEREWVDKAQGDFSDFLKRFNPEPKPMYGSAMEFLKKFEGLDTLFVHGGACRDDELDFISKNGTLSQCVVSNRLLNNPILGIEKAMSKGVSMSLGSDGLSSNNSLNMWDELRAALFAHADVNTLELSKLLIKFATVNGAKALKLDGCGTIEKEKNADIITIVLPDKVSSLDQIPLELILHTTEVKSGYIDGERYV